MSSRDRPRDDDLEERLDELEGVLSELRADLRTSERERQGPPRPPRPPRLSELVRFTEQYTIPTVIALLETTITSLELLRGTLRLLDPGRDVDGGGDATADRLRDVRDGATAGLARSLAELRTALSEADLPEEAASRSIIEDARDLTAEIEGRIEEGRREADAARRSDEPTVDDDRGRGRDRARDGPRDDGNRGAIHIDVTDPDADGDDDGGADGGRAGGEGASDRNDPAADDLPTDDPAADDLPTDDAPEVDVEAELESIKRQLDGIEERDGAGGSDDDADPDETAGSDDDADPDGSDGSDRDRDGTGDPVEG